MCLIHIAFIAIMKLNKPLAPLFPLAGSKFRQRKNILPILARYDRALYVEPFGGAGGLFFGKPQELAEVYNDANRALVNLIKVIRSPEQLAALDSLLERAPMSRALWHESRDLGRAYMRSEPIAELKERAGLATYSDEIAAAYALFYAQIYGFAGDYFGSFGGGCKGRSAGRLQSAGEARKRALADYSARLRTVIIENLDAIDCVEKYDAPDTLFYLDPPYIFKSKHGNPARAYGGLNVDNERMVKTLLNLKGRFVLSCYDADVYKPLEEVAERLQFRAVTTVARDFVKSETYDRVETVYASRLE